MHRAGDVGSKPGPASIGSLDCERMSRRAWRGALSAVLAGATLSATVSCGLSVVGDSPTTSSDGGASAPIPIDAGQGDDGTTPPAEPAAPCTPGVVCDVISSTTILDVAVTEGALYWLDQSGSIGTAAKDGSGARTIVTGEQAPLAGIEADAQYVYWTAGGKRRRASARDGADPRSIADVSGGCLRWRVPSTTLLASAPEEGNIYSIRASDGDRERVVSSALQPWGVAALAADDFFYTNYHREDGRIRRVNRPGVVPSVLDGQRGPRCMATDGASLWWANRDSGALMKSTAAVEDVQVFVPDQRLISGIAIDSTYVYWSFESGIRRRTK